MCSLLLKDLSFNLYWPIKKHPKEGGKKVYIHVNGPGPGHMTKMAAMAINSKNL